MVKAAWLLWKVNLNVIFDGFKIFFLIRYSKGMDGKINLSHSGPRIQHFYRTP